MSVVTGFKVVRRIYVDKEQKYQRFSALNNRSIIYPVRKWTDPPEGTRLLAFQRLEHAQAFADRMRKNAGYNHHFEIWEADLREPQPQEVLAPWYISSWELRRFWDSEIAGRVLSYRYSSAPIGTVSCAGIKLRKRYSTHQ